jgi:hypothetical protein
MPTHFVIAALLLGLPGDGAEPRKAETPREQFERVERRVRRWQPTAEERRFDEIGWAAGIRDAIRLASRHCRPVFLFTHDGHMNVGRC